MHTLSSEQELQAVSGGFSAYDTGANIGSALRAAGSVFIEMGKVYTPVL